MATILLVDDEEDLRDNVEILLASFGHTVLTAGGGAEALAVIERSPPDLVVCDITMPGVSGLDVLRTLRERHPDLADMPFVFLSALADRKDVLAGRDHGADDYLTKPVDLQLLRTTVENRLARRAQQVDLKERQLVRLFRRLKETADAEPVDPGIPVAAPPPPNDSHAQATDPLAAVRALIASREETRLVLLSVPGIMDGWSDLDDARRTRIATAVKDIVASTLDGDDVWTDLGGGHLICATTDMDRLRSLRRSVARMLGTVGVDALSGAIDAVFGDALPVPPAGPVGGDQTGGAVRPAVAQTPAPSSPFATLVRSLVVDYLPVRTAGSRTTTAWRLRIGRGVGVRPRHGSDVLTGGVDDPLLAPLAAHVLDRVSQDFGRRGRPSVGTLLVPMPIQVFQGLAAEETERRINELRRMAPAGAIGLVLTDVDDDVPVRLVRRLREAFDGPFPLTIEPAPGFVRWPGLAQVGVGLVALDMGRFRLPTASDGVAIKAAQAVLRDLKARRIDVMMTGVASAAEAAALETAGCAWLAGRFLGDPRPAPEPIEPAAASRRPLSVA